MVYNYTTPLDALVLLYRKNMYYTLALRSLNSLFLSEKALVLMCLRSKVLKNHWFYCVVAQKSERNHWFYCVFAQKCWKTIGFIDRVAEKH